MTPPKPRQGWFKKTVKTAAVLAAAASPFSTESSSTNPWVVNFTAASSPNVHISELPYDAPEEVRLANGAMVYSDQEALQTLSDLVADFPTL